MRRLGVAAVDALDRRLARERPLTHAQALRLVDELRREAVALGVARVLNRIDVRNAARQSQWGRGSVRQWVRDALFSNAVTSSSEMRAPHLSAMSSRRARALAEADLP
ncbi:MAG: hypothetical protein AAF594_07450 [Bacteroidota bacterium]